MDTIWKLFIMGWVALVAASCGAGFASLMNPVTHNTTTTYNTTTNWTFNILSGNSEVVGVIGLTVVLIMVVRTLRSGGEG